MSWFRKLFGGEGNSAATGDASGSATAGDKEPAFGFRVAIKDPDEAYINTAIAQMLRDKVAMPPAILAALASGTITISQGWNAEEGCTHVWLHPN